MNVIGIFPSRGAIESYGLRKWGDSHRNHPLNSYHVLVFFSILILNQTAAKSLYSHLVLI